MCVKFSIYNCESAHGYFKIQPTRYCGKLDRIPELEEKLVNPTSKKEGDPIWYNGWQQIAFIDPVFIAQSSDSDNIKNLYTIYFCDCQNSLKTVAIRVVLWYTIIAKLY